MRILVHNTQPQLTVFITASWAQRLDVRKDDRISEANYQNTPACYKIIAYIHVKLKSIMFKFSVRAKLVINFIVTKIF